MAIYLGNTKIAGVGSTRRNIGEIVPSTLPIVDAGLHLLDGALISGSGTYSAFVTYVANLVSSYPDLFETEANWQTAVSAYGVCGKFVYDSVNNTVRLPKITGIIEGTTDTTALGDLVEAGLPNITGEYSQTFAGFSESVYTGTGAIAKTAMTSSSGLSSGSASSLSRGKGFTIDASRSNSIYKDSFNTVQPQTIKTLYYICIATSVKTAIEADIDDIATDLNGKADTDLTNITNQGSIVAAKASMPSGNYDTLTLGASGTEYTAPSDGWVYWRKQYSAAGQYIVIMKKNSDEQEYEAAVTWSATSGGSIYAFQPMKKGDWFKLNYTATGTSGLQFLYFVYAEGSKSEQ